MSDRAARRLAWPLAALPLAGVAVAFAVVAETPAAWEADIVDSPFLVLTFGGMGLLIVLADARNRIGWLLIAIADAVGAYTVMTALDAWDGTRAEPFSGAALNELLRNSLDIAALGVLVPRVLLLFPTGRPPSRRWRVVGWAQLVVLGAIVLNLFLPGEIEGSERRNENPLGIGALDWLGGHVVNLVFGLLFVFGALGGVAALLSRFRSARGIERVQLKWVAWGVGAIATCFVLNGILVSFFDDWALQPLLGVSLCLFPLTVGLAVMRYRLYEIDRVISRTLVYGLLTVILGAAYAVLVLAGQAVFSSFAGGGDFAIAGSTLVVAGLFLPARSRVQAFVDRRFYRRRYDAQRTLDAFGARLREQVDLETLSGELRAVVRETVQPAHASLWLRGRG